MAELMIDASRELRPPFRPPDVVAWFAERYPLVKATTVRAHIIGLTSNDPSRHHYGSLARRQPVFHRRGDGTLELFDPDQHLDVEEVDEPVEDGAEATDAAEMPEAEAHEFYLEAHLEQFLLDNWARVDWGRPLRLWRGPEGQSGHQMSTPVGRLDFLCEDRATGALVVVELKRGLPSDRVVGQTARYMGWVAANLAGDRAVEGIVVAHEADDRLRYAVQPVPGLSLLLYEVSFRLRLG